jgi:hypothetical protein
MVAFGEPHTAREHTDGSADQKVLDMLHGP